MRSEEPLPTEALADRLTAATLILDGDSAAVKELFGWAGMPSEYRAGLIAAREEAEAFLRRQKRRSKNARAEDRQRIELAECVVESTHAIIFSMRHSLDFAPIFCAAADELGRFLRHLGIYVQRPVERGEAESPDES